MIEEIPKTTLLKNLKEKVKNNFNKKDITFIQIGVNDGITNDIVVDVIEENDVGIFFEPIPTTYELMLENKKKFSKCTFLNVALLPEKLKHTKKMNLLSQDPLNQGSSFVNINSNRITGQIEVDVTTVGNFLSSHNIDKLDFLFCDAEGIDFLIIDDFLNYLYPEVMFFETCNWWCNEDTQILSSDNQIVLIPSRKNFKLKLERLGYFVIDYYEINNNKSQDMIAIKLNYINYE